MRFIKKRFANGLRAIVAPMQGTEAVTVLVLVGTGANFETEKTAGTAHFLEHLFFRGTKEHPKSEEIDRIIDSIGGAHNAYTSREQTGYWVKASAKHFPLALHFVSDILQNALLKEDDINRERHVVLEEMRVSLDSPARHAGIMLEELIYGNTPYGRPVIGSVENIMRMNRKEFLSFLRTHYTASNTVVVVAGNVNETSALARIEKEFGPLGKGKPIKTPSRPVVKGGPRVKVMERETDQSHIVLGLLGFPYGHKDRPAAELLATILGGYTSSRLVVDIRAKRGLAYTVYAVHYDYTHTGYLEIYAGTRHERKEEVVRSFLEHLRRIRTSLVSDEELSRAKENIKGSFSLSLESTHQVASFLGSHEVLFGETPTPQEVLRKFEQVTREDILRVAQKIIHPKNAFLVMIGNRTDVSKYEEMLKKGL